MTLGITDDGRFAGSTVHERAYGLWLGLALHPGPPGQIDAAAWVAASAAGCVGEAMSALAATPDAQYRICTGCIDAELGWNMYYFLDGSVPVPCRPKDSAQYATDRAAAVRGRRIVEEHFFEQWMRAGGISGKKFWSVPFLEVLG